jgi:hypothetical protein
MTSVILTMAGAVAGILLTVLLQLRVSRSLVMMKNDCML